MTVRDAEKQIAVCLDSVEEWVDEILIADTGSQDGTVQLLEDKYKLRVQRIALQESRCFTLADARNKLIRQARNEWVLTLDADETFIMHNPERLRNMLAQDDVAGYFGRWVNDYATATQFDDYKLFLFRRGVHMLGLVHSSATVDLRQQRLKAKWQDCFHVLHHSNLTTRKARQPFRRKRIRCALTLEPHWTRHHWFLGYSYFLTHQISRARPFLAGALYCENRLFPVERLNAGMILAFSYWQQGERESLEKTLTRLMALRFRDGDDFEMCANLATLAWIESAVRVMKNGTGRMSPPRAFAC